MTGSTNELQKIMAIKTCAHLLTSRPEHEDLLLQTIVNKLGDPQKKTAAAAGHSLRSILENHPVMIHVMSREVMQLAHRPKLSEKALYHCIIFLNQLQLQHSKSYEKLASELVQTYFRLFQVMVQPPPSSKKNKSSDPKPAMKSRLLSALLTGVNRAHPFLPEQDTLENKERMNSLYKIAHYTTSPGTSTQALLLLYHLVIGISPEKMDSSSEKQDRFYRTLYSTISSPTMVCHGGSKHHLTLYFNLLYKSMKRDSNPLRVLAFAKRLLHTISHAIENACGVLSAALFLLSEVSRSQPIFKTFHVQLQSSSSSTSDNIEFDSMKRDPGLAFGESSSDKYDSSMMYQSSKKIWEVCLLKHHFHPTVKTFATSFMNEERGNAIDYGGDPLRDFALMPFLDRFAYRHPKARKKAGNEEDETEDENKKTMVMMKKHVKANNRLPVNNEQFWKEGRKIGADQEFFQKFFTERARRDAVKGIVRGSTNKVEEEEVLDQAIASNEARTEGNSGLLQKLEEDGWDTDPEEEAFANELAEKLMESSGTGKANFDKEDPDMGGWDDMYSSDEDDNDADDDVDFSKMDGISRLEENHTEEEEDDDDDMDDQFSDDEENSNSENIDDEDAFMDADDSDSDEQSEKEADNEDEDGDMEKEEEEFVSMLTQDDDNDEEDSEEETKDEKPSAIDTKSKKQKFASAFEDADDYADVIAKAWADRDKLMSSSKLEDKNVTEDADDKKKKKVSKKRSTSKDLTEATSVGKNKKRKKSKKK